MINFEVSRTIPLTYRLLLVGETFKTEFIKTSSFRLTENVSWGRGGGEIILL
jgi:hypothetical protein